MFRFEVTVALLLLPQFGTSQTMPKSGLSYVRALSFALFVREFSLSPCLTHNSELFLAAVFTYSPLLKVTFNLSTRRAA
jgi:hypothetical protein